MEYRFREEIVNAKKAAMGKMYNLAKQNLQPDQKIINFASGYPAEETFPRKKLNELFSRIISDRYDVQLLQYSPHKGYEPLIQNIKKFLNYNRKLVRDEEDIIITYGSTEGIFLSSFAFLSRGDRIIVEDPTYVNAIKIFQILGAEIVGVPMENDGLNLDIFETEIKKGAKLVYLIPNFNNPSGITTSLEKRKEILRLAYKYNVPIIEDDPYGYLRYRGVSVANIKELDDYGNVIYIGTMSKTIAPAMRIGYIVARKKVIDKLTVLKAFHSNGVSYILQQVTAQLLEDDYVQKHIMSICKIYEEKLLQFEKNIVTYLPETIKYLKPDGGIFAWITFPENINMYEMCRKSAIELHVAMTPGSGFCVSNSDRCNSVRINFVKESLANIEKGIIEIASIL